MAKRYARTHKEYQELYNVSSSTVTRWKQQGFPLDDPGEMNRLRASDPMGGKGKSADNLHGVELKEALLRAELRKKLKAGDELDLKVQRQQGKLVAVDKVRDAGVSIGVLVRSSALRLENDLPPQLEGLTAPRMKRVIREAMRSMLNDLAEFQEDAIEAAVEPD